MSNSNPLSRLTSNWHRRAAVRWFSEDTDLRLDPERADYPEGLLPFAAHDAWLTAPHELRQSVLTWAWIAFNHRTVRGELQLANPAFELVASGAFHGCCGVDARSAASQAIVDEQYHILLHRRSSLATGILRKRTFADSDLPETLSNRAYRKHVDELKDAKLRHLTTLAFATVSEVSINAYLGLLASDRDIQPANTLIVRTHLRDEYCHAQICREFAKEVYASLDLNSREFFIEMLTHAMNAFVATDFSTWSAILERERFPGRLAIIDDARNSPSKSRLLRDYSGLHSLLADLDALELTTFDWGTSSIEPPPAMEEYESFLYPLS